MEKAVFFDRDGVINIDTGYVGFKEQFKFIDGVPKALFNIRMKGYKLVLVTNQSGIARGFYTEDDFWNLCDYMQSELEYDYALFDAIYCCPHHPEAKLTEYKVECDCRKPKPGMFFEAQKDLDIDLKNSIMIGDHASDLIAAKNAGIEKLILVGNHVESEKDKISNIHIFKDLSDVVENYKDF